MNCLDSLDLPYTYTNMLSDHNFTYTPIVTSFYIALNEFDTQN